MMMNNATLAFTCLATLALVGCDSGPGGDTDAGPGTDAGSMMGTDAGSMMGTDAGGMLGEPAEVAIQLGGCTDFTACGGDAVGTWDYDSICIEDPFEAVRDACGDLTFEDTAGTARGRITLDGTSVTRDVTATVQSTAVLGASCAIAGCGTIESALAMVVTTASCAANTTGGCDCAITQTTGISETSGYVVEGTQIVTDDGSRYDYCVAGTSMQHRELGDNPDEPGVYGLNRR